FLGMVRSHQGDYEVARAFYRQGLALSQELKSGLTIAQNLAGLAAAWQAQGQTERAARLFGAADALREVISTPMDPTEHEVFDPPMAAARAALGEAAFAAVHAEGRAMPLEQAIADALEESHPLAAS